MPRMAIAGDCAHCGETARLTDGREVYPNRFDLHELRFWICDGCRAYVGCHKGGDGTEPLGRPGNRELRKARGYVHKVLDPLWQKAENSRKARSRVYKLLREQMGLHHSETHVSMFDLEQCREAWVALRAVRDEMYPPITD